MRMVIGVLVFANDTESALVAVHEVVHEKIGTSSLGDPFDSYVDFTNDEYFGKDQGGPIPSILQISTARFPTDDMRGLKMVDSAMEDNKQAFKESMAEVI
jgi:hypothetical protein